MQKPYQLNVYQCIELSLEDSIIELNDEIITFTLISNS